MHDQKFHIFLMQIIFLTMRVTKDVFKVSTYKKNATRFIPKK